MAVNIAGYQQVKKKLDASHVTLVAVSKTKPIEDIQQLYDLGQRDFGENYVQELVDKYQALPKDIRWHFIGHLQTNKVKYIAPFVHLIHGVDSAKLLSEVNKQAKRTERQIACLLQVFISKEETKFGFDEPELMEVISSLNKNEYEHVTLKGLMGMATFTEDNSLIISEFNMLHNIFEKVKAQLTGTSYPFSILSMGMSADYQFAIDAGSTMVRIGSFLFGERNYKL